MNHVCKAFLWVSYFLVAFPGLSGQVLISLVNVCLSRAICLGTFYPVFSAKSRNEFAGKVVFPHFRSPFYESTSPLTFYAVFSVRSSNEFTGKEFFSSFQGPFVCDHSPPPSFPHFLCFCLGVSIARKVKYDGAGRKTIPQKTENPHS